MQREKTKTNSLASGALSLTVSVVLLKILGLAYKVFLSHLLGDEGMGYFNAAYTVYTFFYLLCATGVPKAVAVMIGSEASLGREAEKRRIFFVCKRLFFFAGAIFTILFLFFCGPFSLLLGSPSALFSMIAIAPSVFFVALSGVLRGYLHGEARFGAIALSQTIEGGARFLFGMICAHIGARIGLPLPQLSAFTVFGITISSFLGWIILYIRYKSLDKGYNSKQKGSNSSADLPADSAANMTDRAITERFLKVAVPITISSAVMGLSGVLDLSILIRRLEAIGYSAQNATALYGNYTTLVIPMINAVSSLLAPLSLCALPVFSGLSTRGDRDGLRLAAHSFLRATAFFAAPCGFGLMFFSADILPLFFELESALVAAPLLSLYAASVLPMCILTLFNTAFEAGGHSGISLLSTSATAFCRLALTYILVGNPAIGMRGAPIAAVLSAAVGLFISYSYLRVGASVRVSLFAASGPPVAAALCAVWLSFLLKASVPALFVGRFPIVGLILFCVVCYGILSYLLGFLPSIAALFYEKRTKKHVSFCD